MAQVGSFGKDLVFKVSSKQVITFNNFRQTISSRWSDSVPIGKKPKSEFNGPDLRKISFTMIFDINLGVKPRKMLEKLERLVCKGVVNPLIIGNKRVGYQKWRITSVGEEWDSILSNGVLTHAKVDVKMEEYVDDSKKKRKSKSSTKKASAQASTKTISYVVKKGDTLWALAKKFLGKGTLYTKIYNANKEVIEATAKKHRKKSSENGHWIYPGTKLKIEVKS